MSSPEQPNEDARLAALAWRRVSRTCEHRAKFDHEPQAAAPFGLVLVEARAPSGHHQRLIADRPHSHAHDLVMLAVALGRAIGRGAHGADSVVQDGALDTKGAEHVPAGHKPCRPQQWRFTQGAKRLRELALSPEQSLRQLASQHGEAVVVVVLIAALSALIVCHNVLAPAFLAPLALNPALRRTRRLVARSAAAARSGALGLATLSFPLCVLVGLALHLLEDSLAPEQCIRMALPLRDGQVGHEVVPGHRRLAGTVHVEHEWVGRVAARTRKDGAHPDLHRLGAPVHVVVLVELVISHRARGGDRLVLLRHYRLLKGVALEQGVVVALLKACSASRVLERAFGLMRERRVWRDAA